MVQTATTIWRDYNTDGVPSSEEYDPKKPDIRAWGTWVEGIITAFTSNGGLIYSSKAAMDADLAHAANSMAWVIGDPVAANNGVYGKVGVSGSGSWTRRSDLPFSFIIASDAGAGTPNAIQATTSIPVSGSALIWMNVFEANTATPVTVSFNGGAALTIKTNSGNDVAVGGLTAGMIVMGIVSGSMFRLVSDQASAAVLAAAEAAQAAAEDAADRAEAAAATALATVATYGGSSSSDSSAAIAAMAAALGFVRFGAGSTLVDADITIDVPIEFQMGAYITAAATRTVTITEVIDSPKQHIFRGDGSFILAHDSDSGEPARQVHASWFGAFPGSNTVDQAPAIQKAFTAMGNSRESKVEFDIGNYTMMTGVTLTRAGWVMGSGNRRTVFLVKGDGFDVFATGHTACRFSDIQFENHPDNVSARTSPFIRIEHDFCVIENVFAQEAFNQIIVGEGGNNCAIREFNMVWRTYPFTAGSTGILVRGSGCNISGVYSNYSSGGGPESLIAVGKGASGNVSAPRINNVSYICASTGVLVHGDSIIVSRGQINDINYRGATGNAPQAVKFLTTGSGGIFGFSVDDVTINGTATADIAFQCNGSGDLKQITVDNVFSSGTTGNGIEFIRTAGLLSDIVIGATVNTRSRANPFSFSGSTTGIRIDPRAMAGGDAAAVFFRGSVADGTAFSITLGKQIFSGTVIITAGTTHMGIFGIRAASSPAVSANKITDANVVAGTAALSGGAGVAAKLNLGVTDGVLYVSNLTGSAQNISLTVMGA
ncbi:hypothetical protein GOE08_07665 [Sinorhizobium medicae]|nr:hypothetical protein [Sinorhizobium medicae]